MPATKGTAISRTRLVIWGASGHARVVADAARASGQFEIVGFLDDFNGSAKRFEGAVILGGRDKLPALRQAGVTHVIVAVGDWQTRLELGRLAEERAFRLAFVVHPRAVVAPDVVIGSGSFVAAGAVVNPGTKLGQHVIVNTAASVDHECIIEEGVHVCPGVRLGGCVTVGRGAWVGIGTTVIDHIRIGAGALVGAGSVVVRDVPERVVAYGNPARVIRPHPG